MEVGDCCRFCHANLRIKGVITGSKKIFDKKANEKSVNEPGVSFPGFYLKPTRKSKFLCLAKKNYSTLDPIHFPV